MALRVSKRVANVWHLPATCNVSLSSALHCRLQRKLPRVTGPLHQWHCKPLQLNHTAFADDTVIYRTISSPADHDLLQRDLDNLESWATTWQMSFNATKCKLLSITNKKKPSKFAYSLGSETLSPTDEHNYLGARCRRDLRWSSHCTKICNKANKRLGLLRRTLKPCDKSIKE